MSTQKKVVIKRISKGIYTIVKPKAAKRRTAAQIKADNDRISNEAWRNAPQIRINAGGTCPQPDWNFSKMPELMPIPSWGKGFSVSSK